MFYEAEPVAYQDLAERLGLARGSIGFIRGRCLKRLERLLERRVGLAWDRVYAEIREHLRVDDPIQLHVLQHLFQYVERYVVMIDGVPHRATSRRPFTRYRRSFYVCPQTGTLRRVAWPMGTAAKRKRTLSIEAEIADWTLTLRMAGAEATVSDGRRVQVCASLDGAAVFVIVHPPKSKAGSVGWRTYAILSDALVRAVDRTDDEVTVEDGIPVTTPARTLFDLAGVVPLAQLRRAVKEAEVKRLWGALSLADLLERHPRRPGAA